jgi:hypothetical protein
MWATAQAMARAMAGRIAMASMARATEATQPMLTQATVGACATAEPMSNAGNGRHARWRLDENLRSCYETQDKRAEEKT